MASSPRARAATSPPYIYASTPSGEQHPAEIEEGRGHSVTSPTSPEADHNVRSPTKGDSLDIVNRRLQRSNTSTSHSYRPKLAGRQWKPGQEPGIDPSGPHPGTAPVGLREYCQITVVDYSQDDIEVRELDNDQLADFLEEGREESLTCRWINVNGLSWDVISLLGREKKFHRLAVEDLLNRRNRTKADWYTDHTYIVLPLQKLVHVHDDDCEHDGEHNPDLANGEAPKPPQRKKKSKSIIRKLARWIDPTANSAINPRLPMQPLNAAYTPGAEQAPEKTSSSSMTPGALQTRTLYAYTGGANVERTEYMEGHSALRSKHLAVGVEQVSIFLCADNTVISFFEASADDLEAPIITRLSSPQTILRRTADASMLVQALLDAIIDMAIPVQAAYKDAIDELELNVLTAPAIQHTRSLYILITELVTFRANINPVASLVNALRDHKASPDTSRRGHAKQDMDTGVKINPLTYTYLGDVEDHILLITDSLDQMRRAADNMIDLIFNTISAYQNESMRQLTAVTILFLPLSFLTGYFGMNFQGAFPALAQGDYYFWEIAAPVGFVVIVILMRDMIARWLLKTKQRRSIYSRRKKRMEGDQDGTNKNKQS